MKDKYGFVYIWYDSWRKMFYIGSHWGTEDDGYVCSSNRMRKAYRRRPTDFRRRIVARVDDRSKLLDEEFKWLDLIPKEQLGKKYYNLENRKFGHWSTDDRKLKTVGAKISASPLRNFRISMANKGRIVSEETREKLRQINLGKKHSEETKRKMSLNHNRIYDDAFREKARLGAKKRPPISEETRKRMSISASNAIRPKHSDETKRKIRESRLRVTAK